MTEEGKKAIALYVILDRDICDFIDMVNETPTPILKILYLMLTIPNKKHDKHTIQLNDAGAKLVNNVLEKRNEL